MTISVIVPVYNAEQTINKCLDSIVNQTYKNLEIILIDDCSKDRSVEIIKEYKDDRIILVEQEKNGGVSKSRNKGLSTATGEFISFVDCDDYISLNFYENLLDVALKNDSDIVMSRIVVIDGNLEKEKKTFKKIKNITEFENKIKENKFGVCWDKLYKRELIENNSLQFKENLMWEDTLFCIQALYFSKILSFCIDAKYFYLKNTSSLTQNNIYEAKRANDKLLMLKEFFIFIEDCICDFKDQVTASKIAIESFTDADKFLNGEYRSKVFLLLGEKNIEKYKIKNYVLKCKVCSILRRIKNILLLKKAKTN